MDITLYLLIVSFLFFFISLGLGLYIYSVQEKIHIERKILADERRMLAEQVAKILNDAQAERKDLYDRLQAGTLPQYKEHADAPNEVTTEEDDGIVDLESAKDEILNG